MSTRRATAITFAFQWAGYGLQIISLVVLARLLLPSDYGVIAMVAAVVNIASVVGDFGLSLAALQSKHLTHAQASNLFWTNTAIGGALAVLIAAGSPLIAGFYRTDVLIPVTLALAVNFLINGMSVQFKVQLNRRGRFALLGTVDVFAAAVGLAVAIVAAALHAGYWALVAQQVTGALTALTAAIVLSRWRPSRPNRKGDLRPFLGFGRDTFGLQIANYLTSNADSLAVGSALGSTALGFYNRGFQLALLPINQVLGPLTRVFLPRLSRFDDIELRATARSIQRLLSYFLVGPYCLLAATCFSLVPLVFGPVWAPAGPVVAALVPGAIFQTLGYLLYWTFLARARTRELFISEVGGRVVMAVLIFVVVGWGEVWVALAVSFGQVLIWVIGIGFFARRIGLSGRELTAQAVAPVVLFGSATGVSALVTAAAHPEGLWAQLVVEAGTWCIVAGAGIALVPSLRRGIRLAAMYLRASR